MEETKLSLVDYINIIKRRRMLMLITFVAIMVLSLVVTFLLPATYRSSALIMIEGQDIPEDLVRSTMTSFADERVQRITQRAMTSVNLSRIIDEQELYPRDIERVPRSEIIEDMREDITIDLVAADVIDPRSGRPTKATIAFSIAFDYRNPVAAQRVANDLVSLYKEVNLTESKDQVEGTASFLENLARDHSDRVLELEAKLAELKTENGLALPDMLPSTLQIMERIGRESAATEAKLQALKNRIIFLEAQLVQTDPYVAGAGDQGVTNPEDALAILESELRIAQSQYAPGHPDVRRYKRMIAELQTQTGVSSAPDVTQIDQQLELARSELDGARARYGQDHPEVTRLTRLMDNLRNERVVAFSSFLSDTVTPAASIANEINVREGPGTDTQVVGTLERGTEASVVDDSNGQWFKIVLENGVQGFVNRSVSVKVPRERAPPAANNAVPDEVPSNPAYITLQANYVQAQSEAESLIGLYRKQQDQLTEYQSIIERTPLVEREYSALFRDLTSAREQLAMTSAKAEEARIGMALVTGQRAQSFNLLEPPIAPTQPHWPNRWVLVFLGFALSLCGTLGAAAMAEGVDDSVRTPGHIAEIIGGPPIGLIPAIASEGDSKKSRRGWFLALLAVLALIAVLLLMAHLLIKPLDVLWFAIMRRLGL